MDHSPWGRGQCMNLLHWFGHPAAPLPWAAEAEADFSVRALLGMKWGRLGKAMILFALISKGHEGAPSVSGRK